MSDVILIGCSKTKTPTFDPQPASDLYTSPLFRKRRAYAEASGKPWFILSALHGLLAPDRRVSRYDWTMGDLSPRETRHWALGVAFELYRIVGTDCDQLVEVHAGAAYTDPLRRPLSAATFTMLTPMKGLQIGEQLAWYRRG